VPVSDADLTTLAASHDIITIGMQADAVRREKHGNRTTFLRVAIVDAAPGAAQTWPAAAGEIRIVGVPASRAAAVARVGEVAAAKGVPVSGFALSDLEQLAAREKATLRETLEELRDSASPSRQRVARLCSMVRVGPKTGRDTSALAARVAFDAA